MRPNAGNLLHIGNRAKFFAPKYLAPGFRVGQLTVLAFHRKDYRGRLIFRCACDCGVRWVIKTGNALLQAKRRGYNSSCIECRRERGRALALKYFEPARRAAIARGELNPADVLRAPLGM